MGAILYQVPYEVTFVAKDLGSGKPITNKWYYRCGAQLVSPPPYGGPLGGGADNLSFLTSCVAAYNASLAPLLNHNYSMTSAISQAIIGKRYSTPLRPIVALTPGTPVTINVGSPHGLLTGQTVVISGVTSPAIVNGNWVITVTSPTQFTLNGSSIAIAWSGDGMVQLVMGNLEFLYFDKVTLLTSVVGGVAGDSLPLFATSSIRRLNPGVGRHWRSRVSLSPMSEADVVDGGFTAGQKAAMATALNGWLISIANGGAAADSNFMFPQVISKSLAFAQASPFTFNNFANNVISFHQQANCGSLVRRKPKLTAVIV